MRLTHTNTLTHLTAWDNVISSLVVALAAFVLSPQPIAHAKTGHQCHGKHQRWHISPFILK